MFDVGSVVQLVDLAPTGNRRTRPCSYTTPGVDNG